MLGAGQGSSEDCVGLCRRGGCWHGACACVRGHMTATCGWQPAPASRSLMPSLVPFLFYGPLAHYHTATHEQTWEQNACPRDYYCRLIYLFNISLAILGCCAEMKRDKAVVNRHKTVPARPPALGPGRVAREPVLRPTRAPRLPPGLGRAWQGAACSSAS